GAAVAETRRTAASASHRPSDARSRRLNADPVVAASRARRTGRCQGSDAAFTGACSGPGDSGRIGDHRGRAAIGAIGGDVRAARGAQDAKWAAQCDVAARDSRPTGASLVSTQASTPATVLDPKS